MPPTCAGVFEDVTCPGPFTDWIEQLYADGITGGCSTTPLLYCPGSSNTRGQMATFLVRTFLDALLAGIQLPPSNADCSRKLGVAYCRGLPTWGS